jgi:hypothetical protein
MPFRLFVRPSNFDECRNFVYFGPLLSVEKMHIFIGIVVLILGFLFGRNCVVLFTLQSSDIFRLRVAHLAARWLVVYRWKWEIWFVCDNSSRNFFFLKNISKCNRIKIIEKTIY